MTELKTPLNTKIEDVPSRMISATYPLAYICFANAIHESAVSLVFRRNKEFFDIFQKEVNRGKEPTQAYVIVGRRLLYHIFTIMKDKKPYRQKIPTI